MTMHLQQLKGMQSSKQGMLKRYHFSIKGIRKGNLFREKWFIKGSGVGLWGRASPYEHLLSTPGVLDSISCQNIGENNSRPNGKNRVGSGGNL